jgi:hypothetical protein
MPKQYTPYTPAPSESGCKHEPLPDINGNIVSPRVHYGDGADSMVECLRCKKYIGRFIKGVLRPI